MIESYQTEVTKKRRNARWFWVIVFSFATFLYFFFQGYYPDVRLGVRQIFQEGSGSTSREDLEDLIRSFGIINIRTTPDTASILIGSGSYGNNEKRMTNYGTYSMSIEQSGYQSNNIEFTIDKEKPYFIEEISLLPVPRYTKTRDIETVYQVSSDVFLLSNTGGRLTASGKVIHTGSITKNPNIKHIGGAYFQSGSTVYEWQGTKLIKSNQDIDNYVDTCPDVEWIASNTLSCPEVQSIYSTNGIYTTGILDISRSLAQTQSGRIISLSDRQLSPAYIYTGSLDALHVLDGDSYISSGGLLKSLDTGVQSIQTHLDSIILAEVVATEVIIVGKKEGKIYLLIRHKKDPIDRMRTIELPDHLDYTEADFIDSEGNMFIKGTTSLLFIYRGASEARWIVDGEILVFFPTRALYQKDGSIWQADWSIPQ